MTRSAEDQSIARSAGKWSQSGVPHKAYRNDLFPGEKWAYNIQGQRENFAHANSVLMEAIDLNGGP